MFDLQVLAYQTDLTRVVTFMIAHEQSMRTYAQIGVPESASSIDRTTRATRNDREGGADQHVPCPDVRLSPGADATQHPMAMDRCWITP